jgi:adenylate kinase family enzyme
VRLYFYFASFAQVPVLITVCYTPHMAKILLVTGPSGAGKTTTCKEFLKHAEGVWAYLNQDDIRQFIKAGYASADDYEKNWSVETKRQWDVSIPICADTAKRYQAAGINCLIDFFAPFEEFQIWKKYLENIRYSVIVLLPNEEFTVNRNSMRQFPAKLRENKIRQNYRKFDTWQADDAVIIDNSNLEILEVVSRLSLL